MNPELFAPAGLPVPVREDAPQVEDEADDAKGYRIVRTERAVFAAQPEATHFRYPYVYGPHQLVPREWCIVRRVLDGRPFIVLPEDGLTLHHYGYAENLAHAVLLGVDKPGTAKGQTYHCADEEVLTLRQVVEIVAGALGRPLEIVSMPWQLATPARPLLAQPLPTHRVLDLGKIQRELGYRDVVPAREALALTARWLAAHPPAPGGQEETVLQDPFDYAAEDRAGRGLAAGARGHARDRVEAPARLHALLQRPRRPRAFEARLRRLSSRPFQEVPWRSTNASRTCRGGATA